MMKDLFAASASRPELPPEEAERRAEMTDLSERLAGADGPAVAEALMRRFGDIEAELTLELTKGASPERFRALEAVREGVLHAKRVLVAVAKP